MTDTSRSDRRHATADKPGESETPSPNRPHFSATPRDETDSKQHGFLKSNDMRNQTDTAQHFEGFF
jgi:hypothetical protein